MSRPVLVHLGLAGLAVALLAAHVAMMGRIQVGGGQGWDGKSYASMLGQAASRLESLVSGRNAEPQGDSPSNTQVFAGGLRALIDGTPVEATTSDSRDAQYFLRPTIIVLNVPAFLIARDAMTAFAAMNYLYAGLLAWMLAAIAGHYGASVGTRMYVVASVGLSIAAGQMYGFYPVLLDLGAQAVIAVALYCVLVGRRRAAAVAALLGMFSKEFGLAAIAFGVHRDLRLRVPIWKVVSTYAPAVVGFLAWRLLISRMYPNVWTAGAVLQNLQAWRNPWFSVWFAYFALTICGGVSMIVAAHASVVVRLFRDEPEWLSFAAIVLIATATGTDFWRYGAYIMPLVVVLLARCSHEWSAPERNWLLAIGALATWCTQWPFVPMDAARYFRDWFPYYIQSGLLVHEVPVWPSLWPVWAWRFTGFGVMMASLVAVHLWFQRRPRHQMPAPALASWRTCP